MATGASTTAPTPVELDLYHVGEEGITPMGTLEGEILEGRLPPATLQEGVGANPSLQVGTLGVGLYLALSEGGEILDLARLSPLVAVAKGGGDSKEEEEGEGSSEKEEEGEDRSEEEEEGEDRSEEEEEGAEEEEEEDEKEVVEILEDDKRTLSLEIRVWVKSSHATVILFDKGRWVSTKSYSIKWLRNDDEELMLRLINKESSQQITSHWLKDCTSKLDFKGSMFSKNLEHTIKKELGIAMNYFTVTKELGIGGTSEVYQCFLKKASMLQYAVKVIKAKSTYDLDAYNGREPREVRIMSWFHNSSTLTFYQAWAAAETYLDEVGGSDFDDDFSALTFQQAWPPSDSYLDEKVLLEEEGSYSSCEEGSVDYDDSRFNVYILMEICFRTLRCIMDIGEHRIDTEEGWLIFEKIAKVVGLIHQNGVVHRDLKPENIFVGDNGDIKLGDFGDSSLVNSYMDGRHGTPDRGTATYKAPELKDGKVSKKVDIYSLGIIFLEIFHPFKTGSQRNHVLMDLKASKYPTNWAGDTSLLKMLTATNPIERASINEILDYVGNRG